MTGEVSGENPDVSGAILQIIIVFLASWLQVRNICPINEYHGGRAIPERFLVKISLKSLFSLTSLQ